MTMRFNGRVLAHLGSDVPPRAFRNGRRTLGTRIPARKYFIPSNNPRSTVLRGIVGALPSVKTARLPGLEANSANAEGETFESLLGSILCEYTFSVKCMDT